MRRPRKYIPCFPHTKSASRGANSRVTVTVNNKQTITPAIIQEMTKIIYVCTKNCVLLGLFPVLTVLLELLLTQKIKTESWKTFRTAKTNDKCHSVIFTLFWWLLVQVTANKRKMGYTVPVKPLKIKKKYNKTKIVIVSQNGFPPIICAPTINVNEMLQNVTNDEHGVDGLLLNTTNTCHCVGHVTWPWSSHK